MTDAKSFDDIIANSTTTTKGLKHAATLSGKGLKIALVSARWNEEIVLEIKRLAINTLLAKGVAAGDITEATVPGAYELPFACKSLVTNGSNRDIDNGINRDVDAVIALGCLIQGETRHFKCIADSTCSRLQQLSLDLGVPIVFGVLTVCNVNQARDRVKHGADYALAAIEMAQYKSQRSPSATQKAPGSCGDCTIPSTGAVKKNTSNRTSETSDSNSDSNSAKNNNSTAVHQAKAESDKIVQQLNQGNEYVAFKKLYAAANSATDTHDTAPAYCLVLSHSCGKSIYGASVAQLTLLENVGGKNFEVFTLERLWNRFYCQHNFCIGERTTCVHIRRYFDQFVQELTRLYPANTQKDYSANRDTALSTK
jgi:6,7-dimethyl-8-ribityllumazine synthase